MPLPANLIDGFEAFRSNLVSYRTFLLARQQQMTGTVTYDVVEQVQRILARAWNEIEDIRSRPGIGGYVQRQFGSATANIGAAAVSLQNATGTALTTIRSATPTLNPGSWVAVYTLSASATAEDQWVYRTVTAAQTATLRGNITSIITAIDALNAELTG